MSKIKNENQSKKQKHPRVPLKGIAYIHDDEHLYAAQLNNLSKGGMFLSQLTALEDSKVVKIVVKSEDLGVPFQASGRIVRVESNNRKGTAIEFISLKNEVQKLIDKRVQEVALEDELKLL